MILKCKLCMEIMWKRIRKLKKPRNFLLLVLFIILFTFYYIYPKKLHYKSVNVLNYSVNECSKEVSFFSCVYLQITETFDFNGCILKL